MALHDFVYSIILSQIYYCVYYLYSAGPMLLTGRICLAMALFSVIFGFVSLLFEMRLTTMLTNLNFFGYKLYFFMKL